ncbi:hypothetical protein [Globicatella sulfidifaciens]|uniref:Uncharacterized protein n=1 Tax=Globicatella sulfidifaciens TaxID=136093 RepID=A0A7X8C1R3_9LACT|nr:hypothetical protein [Globicatella sulfidifaciens]NLJ17373.1 hypothetical protein [Globicatella sulfidifaciens]
MKKLILLLLTVILAGVLYINFIPQSFNSNKMKEEQTTLSDNTNGSQVEIVSDNQAESETTIASTEVETTSPSEAETTVDSLFNEAIINNRDYPQANVPEELLNVDIYTAINEYYIANYSEEEKAANQTALTDVELDNLTEALNQKDALNGLDLTVDQVTMNLDDEKVYIPRVIVPVTYENAQRIAEDNDINILSDVMTEIGNRLIMIAYYNPQEKELYVYHLTNWTKPLFTYTQE